MKFDPSDTQYRSIPSKLAAAFREPANVVGMSVFAAASLALLTLVPVACGAAVEVVYLLLIPNTPWFLKRLDVRFDAQVQAHRAQLKQRVLPKVRMEICDRYNWLETERTQIEPKATVHDKWLREALSKLDFLLEKYLQFAERESEYLTYLLSVLRESAGNMSPEELAKLPPLARYRDKGAIPREEKISQQGAQSLIDSIQGHYDIEIENLSSSIDTEAVLATKEILIKRKEVLTRRREFIVRLSDMMVNLRHQMELIAETFGLINDEIRARSPEQVLADIDEVINQATSLTDALDSLTPVDQVVARA